MEEDYVAFRMKREKAAEIVKAYMELESKLISQGHIADFKAYDVLLPRFFRNLDKIVKRNGYNPDTTMK